MVPAAPTASHRRALRQATAYNGCCVPLASARHAPEATRDPAVPGAPGLAWPGLPQPASRTAAAHSQIAGALATGTPRHQHTTQARSAAATLAGIERVGLHPPSDCSSRPCRRQHSDPGPAGRGSLDPSRRRAARLRSALSAPSPQHGPAARPAARPGQRWQPPTRRSGQVPLTVAQIKRPRNATTATPRPLWPTPDGHDAGATTNPAPAGTTNAPGSPANPNSPRSNHEVRLPY